MSTQHHAIMAMQVVIDHWIRPENDARKATFLNRLSTLYRDRYDYWVYQKLEKIDPPLDQMLVLAQRLCDHRALFGLCPVCKEHVSQAISLIDDDYFPVYDPIMVIVCRNQECIMSTW